MDLLLDEKVNNIAGLPKTSEIPQIWRYALRQLTGGCSRSNLALDEEGHIYYLRSSVAALRKISAYEV